MRPDGDPEPDDYGLPHVDVVVPDDARELARDVVAYRREERRRRRRARVRRLVRPLTRFGVAIPIIAGALLVALVSGALMTTFGPRPAPRPPAAQLAPRPSAPPGRAGGLLPSGEVVYADRDHRARNLVDLRPVVFGIVPAGYRCGPVVAELANLAGRAEIDFLLVADPRPAGGRPPVPVKDLRACAGTAHEGTATIVEDHAGVLARSYAPVPISAPPPGGAPSGSTPPGSAPSQSTPSGGTPSAGARSGSGGRPSGTGGPAPGVRSEAPTGLTAVFVRPDGVVNEVLQSAVPGPDLGSRVMSLRTG